MKNTGIPAALGAYLLWGILPIYWKAIGAVPPSETLAHRMIWSMLLTAALLAWRRDTGWLRGLARRPIVPLTFLLTATILSGNWFVYIWAMINNRIVEASLGYFINPLVNVLLGVIFLRERLRRLQWISVGIAATGVIYLTIQVGQLPWIALTLAFSFGIYGLLRKTAALHSLQGLVVETAYMALPALGYLVYLQQAGRAHFGGDDPMLTVLLPFAGLATALPLLLFAHGARRIPLSSLGILQYLAPTLQFLLGVLVYGEPFDQTRLIGYGCVWVALAIYTGEGLWRWQSGRTRPVQPR